MGWSEEEGQMKRGRVEDRERVLIQERGAGGKGERDERGKDERQRKR